MHSTNAESPHNKKGHVLYPHLGDGRKCTNFQLLLASSQGFGRLVMHPDMPSTQKYLSSMGLSSFKHVFKVVIELRLGV